jgi:hypothetical protein
MKRKGNIMSNAWKRKARHESAHSLIVWQEGGLISKVTIMPQPGEISGARGICYCASAEGQTITARPSKILTANRVHVLIAGRCADELFFPDEPAGHVQDFEELIALMPDSRETLEMHSFDRSKKSIEDFYDQFKGPVLKLFRSRRGKRALFALTDALRQAGTLSGAAVVSILEKAWGKPLPPKAIPASKHIAVIDKGPHLYPDVLFHLGAYLRAMEEDAIRLRGDLPDEEENHLGRIRIHLKMLRLELDAKIKNRGRDHRQASFKSGIAS